MKQNYIILRKLIAKHEALYYDLKSKGIQDAFLKISIANMWGMLAEFKQKF